MSLSSIGAGIIGHQNAINSGYAAQQAASPWSAQAIQQWEKDIHNFQCTKVENGWTFMYRNKTHIASTVDEMMEQMKAAMVVERIEK